MELAWDGETAKILWNDPSLQPAADRWRATGLIAQFDPGQPPLRTRMNEEEFIQRLCLYLNRHYGMTSREKRACPDCGQMVEACPEPCGEWGCDHASHFGLDCPSKEAAAHRNRIKGCIKCGNPVVEAQRVRKTLREGLESTSISYAWQCNSGCVSSDGRPFRYQTRDQMRANQDLAEQAWTALHGRPFPPSTWRPRDV